MAIKIRSRNIYEKQNAKVVDNLINKIEIKYNVVTTEKLFETPVISQKIYLEDLLPQDFLSENGNNTAIQGNIAGTTGYMYYKQFSDGIKVRDTYIKIKLSINEELKNKYISKIYSGGKYVNISKQIQENIDFYLSPESYYFQSDELDLNTSFFDLDRIENNILYVKSEAPKNASNFSIKNAIMNAKSITPENNIPEAQNWTYEVLNGENRYSLTNNYTTPQINADGTPSSLTTLDFQNVFLNSLDNKETNAEDIEIDYDVDKKTYETSEFLIFVKREIFFFATNLFFRTPTNKYKNKYYSSKVIKVTQHAKDLLISFYGDTIGITLTENNVNFISGEKGDKPFTLSTNELLQDGTRTYNEFTAKYLAKNILEQYQNGKETATLLCDFGEYYDEYGGLAISSKKESGDYIIFDFAKPIDFELDYEVQDLDWQKLYIFNSNGNFEIGDLVYFNGEKAEIVYDESMNSQAVKVLKKGLFDGTLGSTIKVYKSKRTIYFGEVEPDEYGVKGHYVYIKEPFFADINIICKDNYGGTIVKHPFTIKKGYTKSEDVADTHIEIVSATYKVPMSIPIGAEVVPYVYTVGRIDKPMSIVNDKQKVFEVVDKNIIYDGISWQKLTLLEKN